MPPKGGRRSRSRQTTPQSPLKRNASLATSPQQSQRNTRSKSHDILQSVQQKKQSAKSLPAVTEEPLIDDEIDPARFSSASEDEIVVDDQNPSDDEIDDTSSNETTQLEALDTDLIIDNLPLLNQSASQVFSLLDVTNKDNLLRELNSPLSKPSKRLRNYVSLLNVSRESFGTGTYIDVSLILRKLAPEHSSRSGPWTPDAILQHANLALFAASLVQNDGAALYDTLERMFNTFPEPFGHFYRNVGKTSYSTDLINETVSFGIALRTQFFLRVVERSRNDPSFDPDSILGKVFFDEDGEINGFQVEGEEILPAAEDAIVKRISHIRRSFKTSSADPIDINQLNVRYSWPRFLQEAFSWISLRRKELDAQIRSQGGVNAIRSRLEDEDFTSYDDNTPYAPATPEVQEHTESVSLPKLAARVDRTPNHPPSSRLSGSIIASRILKLKQHKLENAEAEDDVESEEDEEDENLEVGGVEAEAEAEDEGEEHTDKMEIHHPSPLRRAPVPEPEPVQSTPDIPRSVISEIPQSPEVFVETDAIEEAENYIVVEDDREVDEEESEESEEEESVSQGKDGVEKPSRPDTRPELVLERRSSPPKATQASIIPTQQTLAVLEVAREQAALGNKENIDTTRRLYTDRQANAKRLDWQDSQTGQKRPREESSETEDNESMEFETDERPQKRVRRPRQPPLDAVDDFIANIGDDDEEHQASEQLHDNDLHSSQVDAGSRPPPSTQPLPHRSPAQHRSNGGPAAQPPSSAPQSRRPASKQPQADIQPRSNRNRRRESTASVTPAPAEEETPNSTTEDYRAINAQAKSTMRLRPLLDPNFHSANLTTQVRRPWTVAETNRLFDMIAEHGCQWAHILTMDLKHEEGPALQRRTQVQLKDKARNMKMDYLKAGVELPEGFANVTIKKSDKELLTGLGLPYDV